MFVWRLDEEAKIEFTITVNWHREEGSIATTQLGTPEVSCASQRTVDVCETFANQTSFRRGPRVWRSRQPSPERYDLWLYRRTRLSSRSTPCRVSRASHRANQCFSAPGRPPVRFRLGASVRLSETISSNAPRSSRNSRRQSPRRKHSAIASSICLNFKSCLAPESVHGRAATRIEASIRSISWTKRRRVSSLMRSVDRRR